MQEDPDMTEICASAKTRMRSKGITFRELSFKSGVSVGAASNFINNTGNSTIKTAHKILSTLGMAIIIGVQVKQSTEDLR